MAPLRALCPAEDLPGIPCRVTQILAGRAALLRPGDTVVVTAWPSATTAS
jgi:hypothetical protein